MKKFLPVSFVLILVYCIITIVLTSSCANIIPPSGGAMDTLPPVLISALPRDSATNFTGNRITLNFDEYIDLQNTFENVLVSPLPKNAPLINNSFRTVTIKIKDTLEPNTTYSINFGNALRDINENNIAKNFTYIFSTGNTIDENTISGKVIMAETGKIDSTLIVVLHRSSDDSAVANERPRYFARLDGNGLFQFNNLPAGNFALYAIPNNYSKQFDDSTKPFAFADSIINTVSNKPITLYAYTRAKKDSIKLNASNADKNSKDEKALRMQINLAGNKQDILTQLKLGFNKKIKAFDTLKYVLTDTNYKRINAYRVVFDTTNNLVNIIVNWPPDTYYKLIVDSAAVKDSAGRGLAKTDTISFSTKKLEDYGSVKLRFTNLDLSKNPVLQIVQNEVIVESVPLKQKDFYRKLFTPGDYDIRILNDKNNNGIWDPGKFFGIHQQPEIVVPINTKLSIRGNWDNEKDITL